MKAKNLRILVGIRRSGRRPRDLLAPTIANLVCFMQRALAASLGTVSASFGLALAIYGREALWRRLRWLLDVTPPPPDSALMRGLKTCVFDCDGVIYYHGTAIPGVTAALQALRQAGIRIIFVTNSASQSRTSLAAKLTKIGVHDVSADDCVTSASAAAAYLCSTHPNVKRAYVVGAQGLLDELNLAGIEPVGEADVGGLEALIASGGLNDDVDAVVVGMQAEGLCYARLAKAAAYARDRTKPFIGTNPDQSFPGGLPVLIPAGGCNVKYVSYAAEREPDAVVGKPSGDLARLIAQLYSLRPESTLMVGDRCNTDIAFGHTVGWHTLLVLTGCHDREAISKAAVDERPDYCTGSVADLASLLLCGIKVAA